MTPQEFTDWYDQNHQIIEREKEYKGLLGALHLVYEMGRRDGIREELERQEQKPTFDYVPKWDGQ